MLFFARETYSNGGASRAPIGVKDNGRMRDFCDDDRPAVVMEAGLGEI